MSDVQERLDQDAKEKQAAKTEPKQWNEVVEDIWEKCLPHFGLAETSDFDFLYDAAKGRYLFQNDDLSDEENDLIAGGDDEEEEEMEEGAEKRKEEGEEEAWEGKKRVGEGREENGVKEREQQEDDDEIPDMGMTDAICLWHPKPIEIYVIMMKNVVPLCGS